jgi:ABC-type cobalamin transport system permease subunit
MSGKKRLTIEYLHVARVPVLVWIVAVAIPKLDLIAIGKASIRKVHALPTRGPFNAAL